MMSEQDDRQASPPQCPTTDNPEAWKIYWEKMGQSWRTEPEIDAKRQEQLVQCRTIIPDIEKGTYPFKGMKLKRADVEWLLATLENGRGPVDWEDKSQRNRQGLDLRGADLSHEDLSDLPLACMQGGLTPKVNERSDEKQRNMAKARMKKADLHGAQLQGADLGYAQLQKANLHGAQLQKAKLLGAQLQEVNLAGAEMQEANLLWAEMQKANLHGAQLQKALLGGAKLRDASLHSAQLQGAFLSLAQLDGVDLRMATLADETYGAPRLADVRWGEVNLAVVDWTSVKMLGDERLERKTKDIDDYRAPVRANRQLAVVLRDQGLNEEADRFAYRAQKLQRNVLRRQGLRPQVSLWQRLRAFSSYIFSLFLDLLAGYGYQPAKTLFWYLLVIGGFATAYAIFGHLPPFPDALVFSFMSFHGRGFFPSLSNETNLHNPVVMLAAAEAVIGLLIEISLIATFTQRFFGR
jgi:uncharacterized protein YjbI with pentapeptide repeats